MSDVKISPRRLRFIWADKAALAVALGLLLLLALVWILALIATGTAGAAHVLGGIGIWGVELDLAIAGSLWAILRAVDFAARGSTYRVFMEHAAKQSVTRERAFVSDDQPIMVAMTPAEAPDFVSPVAPLGSA